MDACRLFAKGSCRFGGPHFEYSIHHDILTDALPESCRFSHLSPAARKDLETSASTIVTAPAVSSGPSTFTATQANGQVLQTPTDQQEVDQLKAQIQSLEAKNASLTLELNLNENQSLKNQISDLQANQKSLADRKAEEEHKLNEQINGFKD